MKTKEQWKWILGFERLYRVSSYGRVKSVERTKKAKGESVLKVPDRILKQSKDRYPAIVLYKDGKPYRRTIHTLVLENFAGVRPKGKEGCHKNDIKTDNHISNLYWGTHKQNGVEGSKNRRYRHKITPNQVICIRRVWRRSKNRYGLQSKLAQKYGVNRVTILNIVHYNTYCHCDETSGLNGD